MYLLLLFYISFPIYAFLPALQNLQDASATGVRSSSSPPGWMGEQFPAVLLNYLLGYELDDRGSGVRFPAVVGNFSLHHRVQTGSGASPAP
jgi:hypothetical protein